jgi:CDP-diacylglycerol--glycerol-3-phosphate 3-phosphatidyltransferase
MSLAQAALFSTLPAACLVASFFVYTLLAKRRQKDKDAIARGGKRLLGLHLRDYWYWLHGPAERALLRAGWSPDAISFGGLALTFGAGLAFAAGSFGLGGWLIVVGGAFDILDGRIARARGIGGPAGAFLDSTLDRYGDWALFSGLAVYFGSGPGMWAALLTLGGTFVVSYARARAESLGIACTDGWLQRGERFFFLASAGILTPSIAWLTGVSYSAPMLVVLSLMALLSNATAISR